MESTLDTTKSILISTLQLTCEAKSLTLDTKLLGNIPELDSMAVVSLITAFEDHFDFIVDDDEISADTFETVGALVDFVEEKNK